MNSNGFFTEGFTWRLPHPHVPVRHLLRIHSVVGSGLELLRNSPPKDFHLATALEDEITRQLQWVLENRLFKKTESPRLDRRIFRNVVRAPEVTNYNWIHPAKKPDLAFFLNREKLSVIPTHDAIFAECKPVDSSHNIATHYCDQGMMRFVNGDYAWTMQEGLMVAYVRNRTIARDLAPILADSPRHGVLGNPSAPAQVAGSVSSQYGEPLQCTTHNRSFLWPADYGTACAINVYHSWHDCT